MSYDICEQQRRRSACASAQSNQFVFRCLDSIISLDSIAEIFKILASFCGCAGRFVSGLVGNSRRHVLSYCGSYVLFNLGGDDYTARMRRLICVFIFLIWPKQGFSRHGSVIHFPIVWVLMRCRKETILFPDTEQRKGCLLS